MGGTQYARVIRESNRGSNRKGLIGNNSSSLLSKPGVGELLFQHIGVPTHSQGWNSKGMPFVFGPSLEATEKPCGWTMAEAYHANLTGEWKKLRGSLGALWLKRLLYDADILPHEDIPFKKLPASVADSKQRVWAGFQLLARLTWMDYPNSPIVYTKSFASDWCNVGHRKTYEAIRYLLDENYMEHVGYVGKRMRSYSPVLTGRSGKVSFDEIATEYPELKGEGVANRAR